MATFEQPILGGWQHYLRWETPSTAALWHDNNLGYDTTLSYTDRPGCRSGTCHEYPLFESPQGRALRLRERPLVLMEFSVIAKRYLGLGYSQEALEMMQGLRETCQHVGGDFTLLWHNSHLGSDRDLQCYCALLS
ncbi:hypothetical protein [Thiohalocapsa marina]|uniref:hypothetical protein n=1 Tax=Thiohalocapsa marina TaxID=424902 RepID=UPI0036D9F553